MEVEAFLFPMSFAQQRLWFLDQMTPGRTFYNLGAMTPLSFAVDAGVLERSLNEIVRRHETLRTTFRAVDGQPVQIVAPELRLPLTVTDLRDREKPENEARKLALQEFRQPFDLSRGPLLRPRLLRTGEAEYVLVLALHHIVWDGWSMGVFFRELTALYTAFAMGQSSPLPDLPIQYGDFAVWQRERLQGEALEAQLAYWKRQLAGVPVLQLPTDRPRPAIQTFHGAFHPLRLPRSLIEMARTLSHREGTTLFMTLLAAFQALLGRYSGQEDIVVGSPVAGRNRAELEGLIGFFVNSLVLRGDLSGDPTFRELLGRVRETALGAYAHQDLPFEMLVEQLRPERDTSRNPLFQVMFQLFSTPPPDQPDEPEKPEEEAPPAELDGNRGTAVFDLALHLWDDTRQVSGGIEYSTELFDGATVRRMTVHFARLLEAAVADPDRRLSELDLMGDAERRRIAVEWNDTATAWPLDRCLHQWFEDQVERTPDEAAVVSADSTMSYRELNRRANRLARRLKGMGVGPDVLVGVAMERSPELVVALLGALKAGGAYVPLDPAYPRERLASMLADSHAPVLLTQRHLQSRLPAHSSEVICLDVCEPEPEAGDDHNPATEVTADHLAYVIYTSGSQGRPKGVMIPHRAVSNHMCWMQAQFPLSPADRVLQRTPISFDASVWEFWAPLLAGARLVLAPAGAHLDSALLARTIARHSITRLQLVPSLFRILLQQEEFADCRCLRDIYCGGEALPAGLGRRLGSVLDARLHNLYGPTEACIDATWASYSASDAGEFVPIGRPIGNLRAYVLDRNLQLVPPGVPGELYLGGAGLARGYLNNPALTEEKFISHSLEANGPLYKTGDLVRYRADGALEYLGRMDTQVKIRGVRIELGEIEAVLRRHEAVRDAVVLALWDGSEKRLVAYIVPAGGAPGVEDLRGFLQRHLTEQMIPSAFVPLEALPLMPNGKVDRQRLPAPDHARPSLNGRYLAPRSDLERRIGAVWQEVLGLERVGVEDNFFDLGGHSLLLIQLQGKLQERLPSLGPISIVDLFRYPNVGALAKSLGEQQSGAPAFRPERQRAEKQKAAMTRRRERRKREAAR
ncbi:MAG: amino acid adenylation domain-containing protein [Acidobacteria bacterium]|nr:amino acid adenylation domain-containing protein [Acidobacteriota bacterium]